MAAASTFFDAPTPVPLMNIYPEYTAILDTFIAEPQTGAIGSEPAPLIDSILFLGTFIANNRPLALPPSDEEFNNILQRLSLLSAHRPDPELRYHAHLLTSELLHSHPSELVRLSFIKDTLEHCPYESLKASAVGWLKTEILSADSAAGQSLFATPTALTTLVPLLFEDLHPPTGGIDAKHQEQIITDFRANVPFYLATLNLYYLLLSSPLLFERLEMKRLTEEYDIRSGFLDGLESLLGVVRQEEEGQEGEVELMEGVIERVKEAVQHAGLG